MTNQEIDIDTLIDNVINNSQNNNFEDKSNQILLNEADNEYVYQLLINIFCKFLIKLNGLNFYDNSNNINFNKINSFNIEKIGLIKKYFRTIGFELNIDILYQLDEYDLLDNENYQNRYCKILYKSNPDKIGEFNFMISNNFLNTYLKKNNLNHIEKNIHKIVNNPNLLNIFKGCFINENHDNLFDMFIITFSYI